MPTTNPTTIKLNDAERAQIEELGWAWGTEERPMSMADVIRRCVLMARQAEAKKKTSRKSQNGD